MTDLAWLLAVAVAAFGGCYVAARLILAHMDYVIVGKRKRKLWWRAWERGSDNKPVD